MTNVSTESDSGVPFDVAADEMRERILEALRLKVEGAKAKVEKTQAAHAFAKEAVAQAKAELAHEMSDEAKAAHKAGIEEGLRLENRTPAEKAAAATAAARAALEQALADEAAAGATPQEG